MMESPIKKVCYEQFLKKLRCSYGFCDGVIFENGDSEANKAKPHNGLEK
jgi:hypothetical protein